MQFNPTKTPSYKDLDRIVYTININEVLFKLLYCDSNLEYLEQVEAFSNKIVSSPVIICKFNYTLHYWTYSAHFIDIDDLFKVMYRLLAENIDMTVKTRNYIIEFSLNSTEYEKVILKNSTSKI